MPFKTKTLASKAPASAVFVFLGRGLPTAARAEAKPMAIAATSAAEACRPWVTRTVFPVWAFPTRYRRLAECAAQPAHKIRDAPGACSPEANVCLGVACTARPRATRANESAR